MTKYIYTFIACMIAVFMIHVFVIYIQKPEKTECNGKAYFLPLEKNTAINPLNVEYTVTCKE